VVDLEIPREVEILLVVEELVEAVLVQFFPQQGNLLMEFTQLVVVEEEEQVHHRLLGNLMAPTVVLES
jgi:hypothetical protein